MYARVAKSLLVAAIIALASGGAAGAEVPHTAGGRSLQLVASGLQVPTAFAFGDGHVFEADYGNHAGTVNGGVFLLSGTHARLLPGSPTHAFGLAWHHGWLYLSTYTQLLRWGGFNGSRFAVQQTLYTAPAHFSGFGGIGFGANGRLYAGVSAGDYDNGPTHTPYALELLTFNATGGDLRVFARGIRQPWQMAFPPTSSSPFVSDLGQDQNATSPPDFVMRAHQGDNFGFWRCNWTAPSVCHGYTRPLVFLRPHTDAMGLGVIGSRLYAAEFGVVYPPQVVSMNFAGKGIRTEAGGFAAPIVGLGTNAGWVYVGVTDGHVWRFRPDS